MVRSQHPHRLVVHHPPPRLRRHLPGHQHAHRAISKAKSSLHYARRAGRQQYMVLVTRRLNEKGQTMIQEARDAGITVMGIGMCLDT